MTAALLRAIEGKDSSAQPEARNNRLSMNVIVTVKRLNVFFLPFSVTWPFCRMQMDSSRDSTIFIIAKPFQVCKPSSIMIEPVLLMLESVTHVDPTPGDAAEVTSLSTETFCTIVFAPQGCILSGDELEFISICSKNRQRKLYETAGSDQIS